VCRFKSRASRAKAPWEERITLWSPTERVPEGLERVMQQCICGKECGMSVGIGIYLREWL
jgi:hypothetical protein